jgi:hypothetical protein
LRRKEKFLRGGRAMRKIICRFLGGLLWLAAVNVAIADNFEETKIKAEQGDTRAHVMLGRMYFEGYGVEPDKTKTFYWYKKAADQGDSVAKETLEKIQSK